MKNKKWNKADVELSSNDQSFNMSLDMVTLSNEAMQITSDNVDEFVLTRIRIIKSLVLEGRSDSDFLAALVTIVRQQNHRKDVNIFIQNVTLRNDLDNLPDLLSEASQWQVGCLRLDGKLSGEDVATLATLVKTGHVEKLEIKDMADLEDMADIADLADVVEVIKIGNIKMRTVERVASICRLLRSGSVVDT